MRYILQSVILAGLVCSLHSCDLDVMRCCDQVLHRRNTVAFCTYVNENTDWRCSRLMFDQAYNSRILSALRSHVAKAGPIWNPKMDEIYRLLGLSRSYCNLNIRLTEKLLEKMCRLPEPCYSFIQYQDSFDLLKQMARNSSTSDYLERISLLLPVKLTWKQSLSLLRNDLKLPNDVFELQNDMDLSSSIFILHLQPILGWFHKPSCEEKQYFANCLTAAMQYWLQYNGVDVDEVSKREGISRLSLAVRVSWCALTQLPSKQKTG